MKMIENKIKPEIIIYNDPEIGIFTETFKFNPKTKEEVICGLWINAIEDVEVLNKIINTANRRKETLIEIANRQKDNNNNISENAFFF